MEKVPYNNPQYPQHPSCPPAPYQTTAPQAPPYAPPQAPPYSQSQAPSYAPPQAPPYSQSQAPPCAPPQAVGGYYAGGPVPPPSYHPQPMPPTAAPVYAAPSYPQPQPKKSKGFLSGIFDDVSRGVDSVARDVGGFAGKTFQGDCMSYLSNGSVVQFYYKKTGRTIQIVQHPSENRLIVDVMGYLSPQAFNAHWFVFRESGSIIKLYNQDNYLGVLNGVVMLFKAQNPTVAPTQTRWKVNQSAGSERVVSLSAMHEPGSFLAVSPDDRSLLVEKSNSLSARTYFTIEYVANVLNR